MIYIVEKLWIDPMENHNAHGYELHSYVINEIEAIEIVNKGGLMDKSKCWSLMQNTPNYRYKQLFHYNHL